MTMTFDKKDIFTVVNAEKAQKYIGEEGYFADCLGLLKVLVELNETEILTGIGDENDCFPFKYQTRHYEHLSALFLPAKKVKNIKTIKDICR